MITEEQKAEWLERMTRCATDFDTERSHGTADQILLEIATATGNEALVALYDGMDKWYA